MKYDKTFSNTDVKRIYCNHLNELEKKDVRKFFFEGADCSQFGIDVDESSICETLTLMIDTWVNYFDYTRSFLINIRTTFEGFQRIFERLLPKPLSGYLNQKIDDVLDILIDPAIDGLNKFDVFINECVDFLNDLIC